MAELHVVRKSNSIYPWLLIGLVVLALLLWWLLGRNGGEPRLGAAMNDSTLVRDSSAGMSSSAVRDFTRFTEADPPVSASHNVTADGLRKLAAAIEAVAPSGTVAGMDVGLRADEIRQRADSLQRDPSSLTHARQTREAFLLAATVLQQVQEARYPDMTDETRQVMDAAKGLKADADLLDQTPQVRQFFITAATALRGMAPTS